MNFSNILKLSFRNVILKRAAYIKVLIVLFLVFSMLFTVIFYSNSLSKSYSDYENKNVNKQIIRAYGSINEEQLDIIRSYKQVNGITYGFSTLFNQENGLSIKIEGNSYFFDNLDKFNIGGIFYINKNSDGCIPENYKTALMANRSEKSIAQGHDLKNNNDILVNETIFEACGIEVNENLIGKKLELIVGDDVVKGTICGIMNNNIFELGMIPHSVFCYKPDNMLADNLYEINVSTIKGNEELNNYINSIVEEHGGFCYWFGGDIVEKLTIIEGQEKVCNDFLSLLCISLTLIAFTLISINQFYLLQKNSMFYGILKTNGVTNSEIFTIHLLELVLLCLFSLISAFMLSIGIFFALKVLMSDVLFVKISFSVGIAIGCFFAFLGIGIVLSLLITLLIYNKILKKPVLFLLKHN